MLKNNFKNKMATYNLKFRFMENNFKKKLNRKFIKV